MKRNEISVREFHRDDFQSVVCEGGGGTAARRPTQVEYLARYCERLGARSMVLESFYIDRHYMDEYAAYYSRMLEPPPHAVRRLHLFSEPLSEGDLDGALNRALAGSSEQQAVEAQLSRQYLGFVSIRPLSAVPIGRTVLRRLVGEERDIWATTAHMVHIGNLRLSVEGLAFQQQDLAVGACATAAVWSALSRVARHERMRAPTPAEVSEAAAKHIVPLGRTLPAIAGLTMPQMCEAIRAVGFAPEAFNAGPAPEAFVVALHTYLLSGIPVVLGLRRGGGEGHAVTAVGFQADDEPNPLLQSSVQLRSALIKKLYIHDDRLGPYARANLIPFPKTGSNDEMLVLGIDWPDGSSDLWRIDSAVAPVYPKMRLPVRSLFMLADLLGDAMERIVGQQKLELNVEFKYERGGDYLAGLAGKGFERGSAFLRAVTLSRWCGILRWHLADRAIAEFVYETTDILRDGKQLGRELIRAVVALDGSLAPGLRQLAAVLGAPCLPDV